MIVGVAGGSEVEVVVAELNVEVKVKVRVSTAVLSVPVIVVAADNDVRVTEDSVEVVEAVNVDKAADVVVTDGARKLAVVKLSESL